MSGLLFLNPREAQRQVGARAELAAQKAGLGKYSYIPGVKNTFNNVLGEVLNQLHQDGFMIVKVDDSRIQEGAAKYFAQDQNYPLNLRG